MRKTILGMIIFFLLISFSVPVFARDLSRFTPVYNDYLLTEIGQKIYNYIQGISQEMTHDNRLKITMDINEIIDRYNCDDKLAILTRAVAFGYSKNVIKLVYVKVYVVNKFRKIDKMLLVFDVIKTKQGIPLRKRSRLKG